MRKRVSSTLVITAVCAVLGAALLAGGAQAAVRHFDATVVAKDASAKAVRVRTQGGATVTVKVNARTRFERIGGGFAGLAKGMAIEIDATKSGGAWVATQIEPRSGGGGQEGAGDDHGGSHGGGHDDGPNHT
jgi:hypothetical protein